MFFQSIYQMITAGTDLNIKVSCRECDGFVLLLDQNVADHRQGLIAFNNARYRFDGFEQILNRTGNKLHDRTEKA